MKRRTKTGLGFALIFLGFASFMAGPIIFVIMGFDGPVVILPALIGFFIMVGGGLFLSVGSDIPRRAPSGSGQGTAVAIKCPACGGGARSVDDEGYATCEYCGTRFSVR